MGATEPALATVVIHVSDVERALRFYRDGLGLVVRFDSGAHVQPAMNALSGTDAAVPMRIVAFETAGSGGLALCSFGSPSTEPGAFERAGIVHVGLRVDDVDAALARVDEHGGTRFGSPGVVGPPGRMSRLAFVRDPDGAVVELVQDLPADASRGGPR